jgi:hypothetical protein
MQFPESTVTQEFLSAFLHLWRLWVPLLLLLVCVGWAARRWWGGKLLLFSLVVLMGYAVTVTRTEHARERATRLAWDKLRVPLPKAAKIDGLQLAAGTIVRWNQDKQGHLLTAELGAGQEVSPGIVLVGEVDHLVDEFWRGTLVKNSVLRGWTCTAGKVDIHTSGELRWCALADPQKIEAGVVPAGAAILLDPGEPSNALLHLSNVGMRADPGNLWIPSHAWFVLYSDGELYEAPGSLTLRGVTLGSEDYGVVLRYGDEDVTRWYGGDLVPTPSTLARPSGPVTGWRGDIGSSLTCERGHVIDKGSRVTVPVSGDVVTTTHWDSSKPKAKPFLDSFHCVLGSAE